jgi:hypothetical protein
VPRPARTAPAPLGRRRTADRDRRGGCQVGPTHVLGEVQTRVTSSSADANTPPRTDSARSCSSARRAGSPSSRSSAWPYHVTAAAVSSPRAAPAHASTARYGIRRRPPRPVPVPGVFAEPPLVDAARGESRSRCCCR